MATISSALLDRQSVDVSADKTLAATDCGIVQNVIADGKVITLPSTAAGLSFTIRNGGAPAGGSAGSGSDGSVLVAISPAAADGITGNGFTAANNKDALNTKLTSRVGDEITLTGTGNAGTAAWIISRVSGTWVREA